ncbi:hypothetical protein ZWY2020_023280 [Hordeum vulgare]|nr:hypothetical protein ZWY2020_023280 [Hordeum vulgare]
MAPPGDIQATPSEQPALQDELLEEILLRLTAAADLDGVPCPAPPPAARFARHGRPSSVIRSRAAQSADADATQAVTHKWTGGAPSAGRRRETKEFDIRHGLVSAPAPSAAPAPPDSPPLQFEEGSLSDTWTLSTTASSPYTPACEVADDEDIFEIYDLATFEGSVTHEDFVPKEVLGTVTGAVAACSAEEVEHDAKRRRREVDIDQLLLEQGLEQDRLHREQEAAKAREKGKSVVIYVDDDYDEE